jgi:hypothetical protein
LCGSTCTSLSLDNHCGTCNKTCPSYQSCSNGSCVCPSGETACPNSCENLNTEASNCGKCGNVCPTESPICFGGKCVECEKSTDCPFYESGKGQICVNNTCVCQNNEILCSKGCTTLSSDSSNCGQCGNACPNGETCNNGTCGCNPSTGEIMCNGICTLTNNNSEHCGQCGNACPSYQTCDGNTCLCPSGEVDCPNSVNTNKCSNLSSDPNNCGTCGNACLQGQSCNGGSCMCPVGTNPCNGQCIATNTIDNCGSCGIKCQGNQQCINNGNGYFCECEATTPPMTSCPNGVCTYLNTDSNCGYCGHVCPIGETCVNGACECSGTSSGCIYPEVCTNGKCTCPLTSISCNGTCADPSTDYKNCGYCGRVCTVLNFCSGGQCLLPAGAPSNGQYVIQLLNTTQYLAFSNGIPTVSNTPYLLSVNLFSGNSMFIIDPVSNYLIGCSSGTPGTVIPSGNYTWKVYSAVGGYNIVATNNYDLSISAGNLIMTNTNTNNVFLFYLLE